MERGERRAKDCSSPRCVGGDRKSDPSPAPTSPPNIRLPFARARARVRAREPSFSGNIMPSLWEYSPVSIHILSAVCRRDVGLKSRNILASLLSRRAAVISSLFFLYSQLYFTSPPNRHIYTRFFFIRARIYTSVNPTTVWNYSLPETSQFDRCGSERFNDAQDKWRKRKHPQSCLREETKTIYIPRIRRYYYIVGETWCVSLSLGASLSIHRANPPGVPSASLRIHPAIPHRYVLGFTLLRLTGFRAKTARLKVVIRRAEDPLVWPSISSPRSFALAPFLQPERDWKEHKRWLS